MFKKREYTMSINSTKLLTLKNHANKVSGPQAQVVKENYAKASNIFEEYEKYKAQLSTAEANGGATQSSVGVAFGSASISVEELQAQIINCETKFNEYYAVVNEIPANNNNPSTPNEDDKNKVKPKEFGGFLA